MQPTCHPTMLYNRWLGEIKIYYLLLLLLLLLLSYHYQAGMPTQSSSQATMVGPFQRAKGVPAFIASSSSSCLRHTIFFSATWKIKIQVPEGEGSPRLHRPLQQFMPRDTQFIFCYMEDNTSRHCFRSGSKARFEDQTLKIKTFQFKK
jgi:hypothetical protein